MIKPLTSKNENHTGNVEYVAMARHMSVTLREAADCDDCDDDKLAVFGGPATLPGSAAAT